MNYSEPFHKTIAGGMLSVFLLSFAEVGYAESRDATRSVHPVVAVFHERMLKRAQEVKNIRCVVDGEYYFAKGYLSDRSEDSQDPDWIAMGRPLFPKEDTRLPGHRVYIFDFEKEGVRRDSTVPIAFFDTGVDIYFCTSRTILTYNRGLAQQFTPRDTASAYRNCTKEFRQDLTLSNTSLIDFWADVDDYVICLLAGRYSLVIKQLAAPPEMVAVAESSDSTTKYQVLRRSTGPGSWIEYWVDLSVYPFAIMRFSVFSNEVETKRVEIENRIDSKNATPISFTSVDFNAKTGKIIISRRWKISDFAINQPYRSTDFQTVPAPGMIVSDPYAKDGVTWYRVEPDGSKRSVESIKKERHQGVGHLRLWIVLVINSLLFTSFAFTWVVMKGGKQNK